MSMRYTARNLAFCVLALTPLLAAAPAQAAGTVAGTAITNLATVNYSVGGVAQPVIESSPTGNTTAGAGKGTATQFLVDNKVNLSVVETDQLPANTSPGLTKTGTANAVAVFKLTNTGNNPQGYIFTVTQPATGTSLFGHASSYTAPNATAVVSNAACTSATTTTPTYAGETATAVSTLAPDACVYVMVTADTPAGLPNGAAAIVTLTATTTTAGTATPVVATATADDPTKVDIVLADSANAVHGLTQVAGDGKAFDEDEYFVVAPALTVTKTETTVSDPVNGTTNPKAIPGATMSYTVTVANATGSAIATNVVIADAVPANCTYVPNTVTLNGVAVADGTAYSAGPPATVSVTSASLAAGATATLVFRVTIN